MSKGHPFYCEHCERYGFRSVTADGVIVKEGKVLLLKRAIEPKKGTWTLPGGFVKLEETTERAVIREVEEETGFKTEVENLLGVFSDPQRDVRHVVTVAYLLRVLHGKEKTNEESSQMQWFDLDGLPENIGFDHRQILESVPKK